MKYLHELVTEDIPKEAQVILPELETLEFIRQRRNLHYTMHVSNWGGIFTRILTFLAALLGATLPLTGYYLWSKRLMNESARKGGRR